MQLDKILEMWEKDSKIDDVMLDETSIRIPQLHAKYISLHNEFSLLTKKAEQELKKIKHKKWLYYSGKAEPKDYEDQPFDHKVMKSDVYNWVSVDDDVCKVESKLDYYGSVTSTLNDIIKQIHQLSFTIGNIIKWRMFCNGV